MRKKLEIRRVLKSCTVCGKKINLIIQPSGKHRGGHYFGKMPLYKEGAFENARNKYGTRKWDMGDGLVVGVLKKDPKPYGYAEYWECPPCYWQY